MRRAFYIGIAGAVGAVLRTVIAELIGHEVRFPVATLSVNIIGTFLLCFLISTITERFSIHEDLNAALQIGFLGSFTTLSAFSMETVHLLESGQVVLTFFYVGVSLIGGLSAGLLGFSLGRKRRLT